MKLVDAEPELAGEAGVTQAAQGLRQMASAFVPDAIGGDLVEAKAKFGGSTSHGDEELGVQERLAAGEAEDPNPLAVSVFEETDSCVDFEAVGPFDGHTTVRARQVTLVGAGEGKIVGAEGAGAAAHGSFFATTGKKLDGNGRVHLLVRC